MKIEALSISDTCFPDWTESKEFYELFHFLCDTDKKDLVFGMNTPRSLGVITLKRSYNEVSSIPAFLRFFVKESIMTEYFFCSRGFTRTVVLSENQKNFFMVVDGFFLNSSSEESPFNKDFIEHNFQGDENYRKLMNLSSLIDNTDFFESRPVFFRCITSCKVPLMTSRIEKHIIEEFKKSTTIKYEELFLLSQEKFLCIINEFSYSD
ncbi:hypothetical protein PCE1_004450 [Barthelona sp. PCE]